MYDKYKSELDDTDYAVFGHSLGGLVAYEFVCRIIKNGYKPPVHMFLSGCNPPNIKDLGSMIHTMPDHEFLEAIIKS